MDIESRLENRRSFLVQVATSLASLIALTPFLPLEARGNSSSKSPDLASVELAELGRLIKKDFPGPARDIERRARKHAGLEFEEIISGETAALARIQLLSGERVSAELERGEIVHVGGWLLSYSEAGVALLYAASYSPDEPRSVKIESE